MALQLCTGSFSAHTGDNTYRFVAPQGWHIAFVNFNVITDGAISYVQTSAPVLMDDTWTNNSACYVQIVNTGSVNASMSASMLVSDEPVSQVTVPTGNLAIGSVWGEVQDGG